MTIGTITLTSVISKIIERLFKARITKYPRIKTLITDTHYELKEKRHCPHEPHGLFEEVNCIHDCTETVHLIYLDFQKVFDKVLHERLMAKIEVYGLRGDYSR
ncbi:hypothetical protein FHG87_006143 [Trinorchestia longiramus]|nr:hypothetical protein FHG87_006143 [Trinorchestia longiramus]